MQNNIIKLPDDDGNMHYQRFCPNCHYWFFGENIGDKYCPHCGIQLIWDFEKANLFHETNYDFSLQKYNLCIINKEEIDNAKRESL